MSNQYTPTPRTYTKSNFVELLELITPGVYKEEDFTLSGVELNPLSKIVNTHLLVADNISSVLSISAVANSQTSSLNNISGISQYFVKQNELTKITPYLFETKILLPLSSTLTAFDTSAEYMTYLSGTLLPKIVLATGSKTGGLEENIDTLSSLTGVASPSSVHNYLVDALGWFYFLNTSADGALAWEPSGYVLSSLGNLYLGKDLTTVDGIKGFENYLWRNYSTCTTFSNLGVIPGDFVSGAADAILEPSAGVVATYTSGTQKLENLLTWLDVIYSPSYMDQQDYTVKDAFDSFIDASTKLDNYVSKGPLRKYLNAIGFSFADVTDQIENIGLIYDIQNTKEEYLHHIAELIGWRLLGYSPARWREQLRVAVSLYKRKGTLDSIQYAIDALITNSVFDVSGNAQELWESYIPFLIWYSLATESPYFENLTTWTPGLAVDAGVFTYNSSSLEGNLKIVTDSILLDVYKKFPNNFLFYGEPFPIPRLYKLDHGGNLLEVYTVVNEPGMQPFHIHRPTDVGFQAFKKQAAQRGELAAWEASYGEGPLGLGVYMSGLEHPDVDSDILYLSATGDLEFVFNYRSYTDYPLPPFEEIKYYKDSTLTPQLVAYLAERLKCFGVRPSFADDVHNFILSAGVNTDTNLGSLNEFLMFFSSVQNPPNYNDVISNITNYQHNLLGLWNGKSSHLFIDFDNTDFNFAKTTLEGDSRYALYEASRVARKFAPGHTITRVNLNASALDLYDCSATAWHYVGLDKDDTRAGYTSASILSNFSYSGVSMGTISPGNRDGRGGLNTFKRENVDNILDDPLLKDVNNPITNLSSVARRALRRRNFRYTLPSEGYYDRTGFNAPNSWDASTLEYSMPSSLGEVTLGYVASAGKFYPVVDPVNPSGVWDTCEDLTSPRAFSSIYTSATFPYRGLRELGSNVKWDEYSASTARYVDRSQTPGIYVVMHELFEAEAIDLARSASSFTSSMYWKDDIQSYANSAIASGLVINSFDDYQRFKFGKGLHKLYGDYTNFFQKHPLGLNYLDYTGGNIFAQVFGDGLYNDNFVIDGSAVQTMAGNYVASSFASGLAINYGEGSGVFSTCAVAAYHGNNNVPASGTFIASDVGDIVVPFTGSEFSGGAANNAEFRNPHILSGVEFCNVSGSPPSNAFYLFKVNNKFKVPGQENYLIDNTVIKCKTGGGLPRIRFDLSSYGSRRNYFIKDHKFKLKVKALVGEENASVLGGGQVGVWIHTNVVGGMMWSWTPAGKWVLHESKETTSENVINSYSHIHTFGIMEPNPQTQEYCIGNIVGQDTVINNLSLNQILEEYFETFEINFDTRNYTIYNNYEYLDIIPVPEKYYKVKEQVNTDDTNYYVEVFFLTPTVEAKYLLIDSISLEDSTQRDQAAIGTNRGVETSGIPFRKFVKENKLYLDKEQLRTVLKFFNGLIGQGTGMYATSLASRDPVITSGTLEVSGGSRLNYRLSPKWGSDNVGNQDSTFKNFTSLTVDN